MPGCAVPHCSSHGGFSFPADDRLCHLWCVAIDRRDAEGYLWHPGHPRANFRVCKNHFKPDEITLKSSRNYLLPGTIPSIFPSREHNDNSISYRYEAKHYKKGGPPVRTNLKPLSKPLYVKKGLSCCVPDCNHTEFGHADRGVILYRFPNDERKKLWASAIGKKNSDGKPWFPDANSAICSFHFSGGAKSNEKSNPSYLPTIFPKKDEKFPDEVHGFNRCCIKGCESIKYYDAPRGIDFFPFPKEDEERRILWVNALKRANAKYNYEPNIQHDLVCSNHFISGKPINDKDSFDFLPSLFDEPEFEMDYQIESQDHSSHESSEKSKNAFEPNCLPLSNKRLRVEEMSSNERLRLEVEAAYRASYVKLKRVDQDIEHKAVYESAVANCQNQKGSVANLIPISSNPIQLLQERQTNDGKEVNSQSLESKKDSKLLDKDEVIEEKCRQIETLEKQLQAYKQMVQEMKNKHDSKDDVDETLRSISKPEIPSDCELIFSRGYRMIELQMLRFALSNAQNCLCSVKGSGQKSKLSLLEVDPRNSHEDLTTQLALVCAGCSKATIFPTSSFSETSPANYSLNKRLIKKLGKTSYLKLKDLVQNAEVMGKIPLSKNIPSQLILSIDNTDFKRHYVNTSEMSGRVETSENETLERARSSKPQSDPPKSFLPVNYRLKCLPPGSKIQGRLIETTDQQSGLTPGVYQIMKDESLLPTYLAVKNENLASEGLKSTPKKKKAKKDPKEKLKSPGKSLTFDMVDLTLDDIILNDGNIKQTECDSSRQNIAEFLEVKTNIEGKKTFEILSVPKRCFEAKIPSLP